MNLKIFLHQNKLYFFSPNFFQVPSYRLHGMLTGQCHSRIFDSRTSQICPRKVGFNSTRKPPHQGLLNVAMFKRHKVRVGLSAKDLVRKTLTSHFTCVCMYTVSRLILRISFWRHSSLKMNHCWDQQLV